MLQSKRGFRRQNKAKVRQTDNEREKNCLSKAERKTRKIFYHPGYQCQ